MLEIVTSRNAMLYRDALEDMFRLFGRESEGWATSGKDRFDTDAALYLLLTRDDGLVQGAHRLLPTTGPHQLSDVTPELCDVRGVARGAAILELSRSVLDETGTDRHAIETARNRLTVGLFEFCLRAGYDAFTWVVPTDMLFHLLLLGLGIAPLGVPVETGGRRAVAVRIRTDRAAFEVLRMALHVPEPQVHYVGAPAGDPLVLAPADGPLSSRAAA